MTRFRACGKQFSTGELQTIRSIIETPDRPNRAEISRRVCQALRWVRPDGQLKDMSCRVALLRMHRQDLITLPPPKTRNGNGRCMRTTSSRSNPQNPITQKAGKLEQLCLQLIEQKNQSSLWNEYIHRYHYLTYTPLPGAQLRYFIQTKHQILGALGFGAAAWKTAPRDRWIGWDQTQRKNRLHLIVNNARFLILPWVTSDNLASKVLAMAARRITDDWLKRYGYQPVIMETFVEKQRFPGTSYKAANWIYLGDTKGRGKLDVHHKNPLPIKAIFVYPLIKNFREKLIH